MLRSDYNAHIHETTNDTMPTPFTHLNSAQQFLRDPRLPAEIYELLDAHRSAFLLGSVAADARVDSGAGRDTTHFYAYGAPIIKAPWRIMLEMYPSLQHTTDAAQRAFLAGYVAHLAMDTIWTVEMLGEYFVRRDWGESQQMRFVMLHVLLITMDERDERKLEAWQAPTLANAVPQGWLPFMSDSVLAHWRDLIAEQIMPGGVSRTLEIFGGRIRKTPAELRAILDVPQIMTRDLWAHVPPDDLAQIEARMYEDALAQMLLYLAEY